MISSARPIKNIHVSAFNGSQSLWCRWITRASDYRFRHKRLQMPSGNPHCIHFTQRPRNGQKRASLRQCQQHCGSALFRRLAISPSRPSIGPFTQPLHRRHRTAMLSLRRARRIRSFFEPALRIHPFFAPPPPPFFAPARRICPFLCPPPSSHPHAMQVTLYSRSICSSMRFTSFLVPPPRPCLAHSHLGRGQCCASQAVSVSRMSHTKQQTTAGRENVANHCVRGGRPRRGTYGQCTSSLGTETSVSS